MKNQNLVLVLGMATLVSWSTPMNAQSSVPYYFAAAPKGETLYSLVDIYANETVCNNARVLFQRNNPDLSVSTCSEWAP